jgi:hypothetical protein
LKDSLNGVCVVSTNRLCSYRAGFLAPQFKFRSKAHVAL